MFLCCASRWFIRKSRDPITEPWGLPIFMGRVSDILLFIAVYWVLSVRYVLNNFKGMPLIPQCSSFIRTMSWFKSIKCFLKVKKDSTSYFSIIYCFSNFFSDANYPANYFIVCEMMISKTKLIIEETVIIV